MVKSRIILHISAISILLLFGFLAISSGSTTAKSATRKTVAGTGITVVEGADVAEFNEAIIRPAGINPRTGQAKGDASAVPATKLKPKEETLPPPVYAISGFKGQPIAEGDPRWEVVDVVVKLQNKEVFGQPILEGTDVTEWIENLPKGLEANIHAVKKGANQAKIYVSGTPEESKRDLIRVTIPGSFLKSGNPQSFKSPTENESDQVGVQERAKIEGGN
jgi:hypothetical protein